MEPKQPITTKVLKFILGGVVVAFMVNLASSGLHDYFVDEYGDGYQMEAVLLVLGWSYLPYIIAIVGVVGVWKWSQGAPPEQIVEKIVYRDPEPPAAMLTVDDYYGGGALYFRVSVVGNPPLSVVKFQLETTGQSVVPTSEITVGADGSKFLQQGGASGATWAEQNLDYLRTPLGFEGAQVRSGWIAFRVPENGKEFLLLGHDPYITALLSDGRTLRARYNPDDF